MEIDNAFDRALDVRQVREPFRGAAVDVAATTELAWDAARAIFGDLATPSTAIAMAELMLRASGRLAMP